MDRKRFIRALGLTGMASAVNVHAPLHSQPKIADNLLDNKEGYPKIPAGERLYQEPFPVYQDSPSPNNIDDWGVVMTTSPSDKVLRRNFGMGTVVYTIDEAGPANVKGETLEESIEKLAKIPFGHKLYMRVSWKDLQNKPGVINPVKAWDLTLEKAAKYGKKVGIRVMMQNPNKEGNALPDFVADQVKFTDLNNKVGKENQTGGLPDKKQTMPDYADPNFQKYWREFEELLAKSYNDDPQIEFVDTAMYGFWGEGHNWPIKTISFPDHISAKETFDGMFQFQLKNWTKKPLLTNTQPDYNHVGNDSLVAETLRTGNWLRSDTIFIENQQIDEISNRPAWIGGAIEVGMFRKETGKVYSSSESTPSANMMQHAIDIGCNYCSLWDWQHINANVIMDYYSRYPEPIDQLERKIGYRIRPSFIWLVEMANREALVFGLVNDGIAGVPGLLKLVLKTAAGEIVEQGYLDAGYPHPVGVRQARMMLPRGMEWTELKLYAYLNVKGQLYPVEWACREDVDDDGGLTLFSNVSS